MKSYQALAALLDYPSAELIAALPEIRALLESESQLSGAATAQLSPLLDRLSSVDLMDLQEAYVDLFDRSRATSLNLFEHIHGEDRDRGQAMVDLKYKYHQAGFELIAHQLPDYLPVLLEYLSQLSSEEAVDMLSECSHILQSIGTALIKRQSPYAGVFSWLLEHAGEGELQSREPDPTIVSAADDDSSPEALDRAWAETPITFMGGCAPSQPAVVRFHKGAPS